MRATAFRSFGPVLASALMALALVWAASHTRPWQALEYKTFDVMTALAAPLRATQPVVVLAIDEPTFQELGQGWPFPRSLHARLLQRLHADGARAVGFDVVFADPASEAEDAALERAIQDAAATPVVLAAAREKVESGNAVLWTDVPPLQRFVQAGALPGDAVVEPDEDFVVRRASAQPGSLAMQLAQRMAGDAALEPLDYIAYRGPRGTFDTRSYYQAVLPGLLPPGFFKDKIVLVGRSARTATELQGAHADLFNAPFATMGGERMMPGVELQATQIDNLLAPERLRAAPEGWSAALMAGMLLALVWAGWRWHPGAAAALAGGLTLGTGLLSWALFTGPRLWLPPLLPMAAALAMYGATALVGYARARRRARQTRAMFAQYVPPEVVARLVAQPELLRLGGESREVTLLFTDLANFTTLSEQLSAEQTVEVLTGYFNAMTPLIHRAGGTVDKFIGDAVMAFWGAPLDDPDHAAHAVEAAIAMQQAMDRLVADLRARGLPPIHMRIGLHSGRVVVGNVGSEQRFSYTAIGDAVNLAARLEGANKAFGTGILLSGATAARLPSTAGLRALDDVIVKGKTEPVRVYTPCADAALCTLSAEALDAFASRRWDEAEERLWALLAALPGDLAAQRLLHRVEEGRALPPGAPWTAAVALDKL